jgi:hypothetical protein
MTDQTFQATSLSVTCCAHGTVSINFHGPDGRIFAVASMDPETALNVADDIIDHIDAHEVAGHA